MKKLLFIFLFFSVFVPQAKADLISSVRQYDDVTLSKSMLKKVKKYNHLVQYFSSFAYFRPNYKVSPYFIHALILAESAGDPRAVSSKDALGLGQILLTTAQAAGKELAKSPIKFRYVTKKKLANLKRNDLFKPSINILLTCYLISKYNEKFQGKLELVLTAWNAGEYTKSLKEMRHAEYKETENLIGKVNGYYLYLLKNR